MTTTTTTTTAPARAALHAAPPPRLLADTLVIAKRHLLALSRQPQLLVFVVVQPIMFVLLFRFVFGGAIRTPPGYSYVDYLMPGIITQTVAFGATGTAVAMADDLQKGIIDRFRALPMSRSAVIGGRVMADVARLCLTISIMTTVGVLIGWRPELNPLRLLGGLLFALAFGQAMSWLSAFIGLSVRTVETAQAASFGRHLPAHLRLVGVRARAVHARLAPGLRPGQPDHARGVVHPLPDPRRSDGPDLVAGPPVADRHHRRRLRGLHQEVQADRGVEPPTPAPPPELAHFWLSWTPEVGKPAWWGGAVSPLSVGCHGGGATWAERHTTAGAPTHGEEPMKRRTLVISSTAGLAAAGLLAVLGVVLAANASFAKTYVRDQLGQQKITFKSAETLTEHERRSPCLVKYAGQALTTGKQAECYANDFIGLHVKEVAGGKTYAELGGPERALTAKVAEAEKANDPALPAMQKQLAGMRAQRGTLFQGETSRGLLLTSFGFSDLGAKAGQAATVAFGAAALLTLLSLATLTRALTRKTAPSVEPQKASTEKKHLVTA